MSEADDREVDDPADQDQAPGDCHGPHWQTPPRLMKKRNVLKILGSASRAVSAIRLLDSLSNVSQGATQDSGDVHLRATDPLGDLRLGLSEPQTNDELLASIRAPVSFRFPG
jgi:hypothetical protein